MSSGMAARAFTRAGRTALWRVAGVGTDQPRGIAGGQDAAGSLQRRGDVGPQTVGVVVAAVERHPRRGRPVWAVQPLGHQGGLAVAGRRGHEGDRMADRSIQSVDQTVPLDPAVPSGGPMELGLEELVDRGCGCDEITERRHCSAARHRHLTHGLGAPQDYTYIVVSRVQATGERVVSARGRQCCGTRSPPGTGSAVTRRTPSTAALVEEGALAPVTKQWPGCGPVRGFRDGPDGPPQPTAGLA